MVGQQGLGTRLGQGVELLRVLGQELQGLGHFAGHGLAWEVGGGHAFEQLGGGVVAQPFGVAAAFDGQGHGFLGHHLVGLAAAHVAELVAQAQQHDGGDHIDRIGDGGGAARGDAGGGSSVFARLQGVFEQVVGQHAHQGVAAVQFGKVQRQRGVGCAGGAFGHQAFVGQALAQGLGQVLGVQAVGLAARGLQRGAQARAGALHKALHVGAAAQGGLLFLPFGQHFVGADTALGKHGAVGLGFFERVGPLGLQGGQQGLGFFKVKAQLGLGAAAAFALHERSLDEGLVDALLVFRHGHEHAQLFLNGLALAQDDVEHKAIDRVVLAIEHGAAHLGGLLAKAVHAAFALFVAGGVPGQVVVDDGGEQVLQVDTL